MSKTTGRATGRGGYHDGGRKTLGTDSQVGQTKSVAIRLPERMRCEVEALAKGMGVKPAKIYRDLIDIGLAQIKKAS